MASAIWVAQLEISQETARKISSRHHLAVDDVRQAIVCVSGLAFTWHHDTERGWRAIIETTIGGSRVLVVLYPADHPLGDAWHLGSAYPLSK